MGTLRAARPVVNDRLPTHLPHRRTGNEPRTGQNIVRAGARFTPVNDTTALLIGGRGFIGSALAGALVDRGYRIVCAEPTATTLGRLTPYSAHVELRSGSVADPEALAELVHEVSPACVVNLAYSRGLGIADEMDVMCRGIWNTLEAARLAGCKRVVLASSVRVYGPQREHGDETVLDEESRCKPIARYGYYKLVGEQLARDYSSTHDMEASALRIPMAYGPGVREGAFGVCAPAVAAANGSSIVLPYDSESQLCLAHVDEVATALAMLADPANPAPRHGVYELGGSITSYAQMAAIATELAPGASIEFAPAEQRPEQDFAYRLDGSRLREEFGLQHRSVRDGYQTIIDHIRAGAEGGRAR